MLGLPAVDPAEALADLTEISSQIEAAVIAEAEGRLVASTFDDEQRGERVARAALDLVRAADETPGETRPVELAQLEAATPAGSVFVVRDDRRLIAAVTPPHATAGLVFYDLTTCLRLVREGVGDEERRGPRTTRQRATRGAKTDAGTANADA